MSRWCSARPVVLLSSSRSRINLPDKPRWMCSHPNLQTACVVLLISKKRSPSFSFTPWLCPVSDNCWTRRMKRSDNGKPRSLLDSIFIYLCYHSAPTHESGHTYVIKNPDCVLISAPNVNVLFIAMVGILIHLRASNFFSQFTQKIHSRISSVATMNFLIKFVICLVWLLLGYVKLQNVINK